MLTYCTSFVFVKLSTLLMYGRHDECTKQYKNFYEKVIKRSKKYHAHDESNKFKEGEKVSIIECKPYSKKKTWQVME